MEPLSIALGLSKLVPQVVSWFGNDDDVKTAETLIDVARTVTGTDDPQDAVKQIENDPALQIQFQQAMQPVIIARMEATTKRLEAVNQTMRAEYASKSRFVSSWRPTFGYLVALSWFLMMAALSYVIFDSPKEAPAIISAMASLSFMWGIAMAVLGVNVQQRSKDKQTAAGVAQSPGIMSSLAQRFIGR